MKLLPLALACLVPFSFSLAYGEGHAEASPDLVDVALADPQFSTLVTALQAADLVNTLRGDGPFTVFAPTNEAFAKLPAGTIAALLQPAKQAELKRVLLHHVVAGTIRSGDLLKVTSAKTVAGTSAAIGLRIGNANVTAADITCANGVIHVIDAVLLPPPVTTPTASSDVASIETTIDHAISKGVALFNGGDHAGCARVYATAAQAIADAPHATPLMRKRMHAAIAKDLSATDRAWALRDALDQTLLDLDFTPSVEAPMPTGFPAPSAVGQVILKQYPTYRAARASGGNGAFWSLFQHIKKNNVEMTAPVEMTMDKDMRQQDMAFLYERLNQGSAGAQGSVAVLDLPSMQVLSIGMRGERDSESLAMAKALVTKQLTDGGWKPAGDWRVLGYNSPMVPSARRFWELQIPVIR